MTWLSGWNYRRPITISNTGSGLTDYQVQTTLDTASLIIAGKMNSNCGDIRFTDSDGSTLLSHWLESGCNASSTKIWVKVPSIPTGTKTIYIYYNNPTAVSTSSGSSTFMFFDDGEGKTPGSSLSTGGWTDVAYDMYSNDRAHSGSISLKLDAPGTSYGTASRTVTKPTPNSWILEAKVYDLISGGIYDFAQFGIDNASTRGIGLRWEKNIAGNNYSYVIDGTKTTTGITRSIGWHTFRIVYDGSNLSLFIDNIQVKSPSVYSDVTYRLGIFDQDNNGVWFDNIIYRKYTSPEPTIDPLGAEQIECTPCTPNLIVLLQKLSNQPPGYLDIYDISKFIDNYIDNYR